MNKLLVGIITLLSLYSIFTTYKLNNQSPEYIVTRDTIPGDTVFTSNTIIKPIPYIVVQYNVDTIEIPSDTTEFIKRYKSMYSKLYASKTYTDTLKNVSDNDLIYKAYLSQNSLDSLNIQCKNNRIISVTNTTLFTEPKLKAGLLLGYNNVSALLSYKAFNNFSLLASYNILEKTPLVGILYNIK